MTDREKALACLDGLHPGALSYTDWLNVGMALEHSGCTAAAWDAWSQRDQPRYKAGECERKWKGFRGHKPAVTVASLIELTRQYGTLPDGLWDFGGGDGGTWDWSDPLPRGKHEPTPQWVQSEELPPPAADWAPMDLARYLECMFQAEERVGLCVETWKPDGDKDVRWLPKKGVYGRTASQLIEEIHNCKGDIGSVIGDVHPDAGAWIRINPLDGNGVRDENVTVLRHALLEADEGDLGQQLALIREMQLPVSAIVHSGGKSIHALVRVEAKDMGEYRSRVDYLYKTAERYGLKLDGQNRNPSRLSRMPGVSRGGRPQYLISGPAGVKDWAAWVNHVEDLKDDLPDPETLSLDDLPTLAPELIRGTLRQGRKLMLSGPSKAGKTFSLMGLCTAIANGSEWMGMECTQGKVLYLNLELPADTCAHRFRDVYQAAGGIPANYGNIMVWNLRGQSAPLDKLAPKLIRRCDGRGFVAIVVDPIYKVTTGDENDAADMSAFCNALDKIALRIGASVIYCHHHSKGAQGHKRSMDRASGSGVLARDTDALVDMIELELSKDRRAQLESKLVTEALDAVISEISPAGNKVEEESRAPGHTYMEAAQAAYPGNFELFREAHLKAFNKAQSMSGWRIECTLREFAFPLPRRVWFDYPVHRPDAWDLLTDAKAAGEEPAWKAERASKEEAKADRDERLGKETKEAIESCGGIGRATVAKVQKKLKLKTDKATRDRIRNYSGFDVARGVVVDADSVIEKDVEK